MSTTTAEVTSENVAPPRFRIGLRHVSFVLVLFGLIFAGYLSYAKLFNAPVVCIENGPFDCSLVESSAWSRFMGIPVAYLGLGAHLTLGAILLLEKRVKLLTEYGVMLMFALTLFGIMYHSYLIYVSANILKALCPWCLAAAVTMYLQFIVTALRLRRTLFA